MAKQECCHGLEELFRLKHVRGQGETKRTPKPKPVMARFEGTNGGDIRLVLEREANEYVIQTRAPGARTFQEWDRFPFTPYPFERVREAMDRFARVWQTVF